MTSSFRRLNERLQISSKPRKHITLPATPAAAADPRHDAKSASAAALRADATQGINWALPLELSIEVRAAKAPTASLAPTAATAAAAELERFAEPFHDDNLATRHGYDPDFLGESVSLPQAKSEQDLAQLEDGSHLLQYEHFSLVMHKQRRLALFTASNVDAAPARKRPEPGRDYSRRGLSGLGPHDLEKWFTDPRIPLDQQLSDRFFSKDRGAFDKGHIVRRDDVAWGSSYDELRRANGDTFHITNCSPQVANFNRSNLQGLWGELENIVLDQAAGERYCLFAGPLLLDDDPSFSGVDDDRAVSIQIPRKFWKIVVARAADQLQTFAFLLDQDLSNTDLEFAVEADWRTRMISIPQLEQLIGTLAFPSALDDADQIGAPPGEAIRVSAGIEMISPDPA